MKLPAATIAVSICVALAVSACARIHETRTAKSYEDAKVTHREHLADEGLVQLAARQDGTRLEVKLAEVQLCRDEVSVSRGVEVTTRLERTTRAATAEWIAFGATAAMSLASYSAASSGCDEPQALFCGTQVLGAMGMVVFIPATVVTGFILLIDSARAADDTERLEQRRSSYQRVQICRQTPKEGVRIGAVAGGTRSSATTDERGKAQLDLSLQRYPQQETTVELMLDDVKLGSVPVSSQWRSALIRRNAR